MVPEHDFQEIIEAATAFFVPATDSSLDHNIGPLARSDAVFFNPAMRSNRDISVLFERVVAEDGWNVLDGLAASGSRSMRLYEEGIHDCHITVNDHNQLAFDLIQKNIEHWDRGDRLTPSKRGLHGLFPERMFHWVDIDPFGSPVDFLDGAIRAVKNNGILSITATDTAPLCGTYPTTCIRRYGARPLHTGTMHDTGLRILVGNAISRAAVFDISATPLVSYFSGHYFRAYFRIKKGAKLSDDLIKKIGYIIKDRKGGYRETTWPIPGEIYGGPMWMGALNDTDTLNKMVKEDDKVHENISSDTISLLKLLAGETPFPPFVYTTDEIASHCKVHPPNTKKLVSQLIEEGHQASLVHYDTKGLRTDASWEELSAIVIKLHK